MTAYIVNDSRALWAATFKRELAVALEEIGIIAERYAANMTPVDTGRLRNSITHVVDIGGGYVAIGTNVYYAPFIELGHHSYPGANGGRGFLRPAASEHAAEYRRILQSRLKGA